MKVRHLRNYAFMLKNFRNGVELVRSMRGGPEAVEAIEWSGVRLVHPRHQGGLVGTIKELWIDQCYTGGGFYHPRPGDVIIDAGAHIGLFSIWMARSSRHCRIIALEPFRDNFRCLIQNIVASGCDQIKPCRIAVGGEVGWSLMRDCTNRSIDHRSVAADCASPERIATLPLSGLLDLAPTQSVAFLKMDIEGAEHAAFASATPATLRRCERIALEYHDNLVPGTLDLLRRKLAPTHTIEVYPTGTRGYGILRATLKTLSEPQL